MAPDPAQPVSSAWAAVERLQEEYKKLFAEFTGYQQMLAALAALARRHGGVLVFDPAELAEVPACASLVASKTRDGQFVVRLVGDGQPGSAG